MRGAWILALAWSCQGSTEPAALPSTPPSAETPPLAPSTQSRAPSFEPAEGRPGPPIVGEGPDALALTAPTPARHALLLVIDTLRADVQQAAHTPVLDALARDGAAVPQAWSSGTWTVPSVVSMFTGMSVREHGWDESTGQLGHYRPLPELPTLAGRLAEQGFVTHGRYANPYLDEELGFDRGFGTWRRSVDRAIPEQLAATVKRQWGDGKRHFAYVHLIGPHSPLAPSEAAKERHGLEASWFQERGSMNIGVAKRNRTGSAADAYRRAYQAVVEDTDARVGEILAALGKHRQDTVVLVTSDHGELLGEHDVFGHGWWAWSQLSAVPLIVDHPKLSGEEESLPHHLGIASVPALLFTALGLDPSPWPTPADASLPLVTQRQGKVALSPDGRLRGVWHTAELEVFDTWEDPTEDHPLEGDRGLPGARAAWEAMVPAGARTEGPEVSLDPAVQEELRELGYLDDE